MFLLQPSDGRRGLAKRAPNETTAGMKNTRTTAAEKNINKSAVLSRRKRKQYDRSANAGKTKNKLNVNSEEASSKAFYSFYAYIAG